MTTNASAPHPICIGQADELLRAFFTDWGLAKNVSSLKMIALAWGSLRVATLLARMGLVLQAPPVQRQAIESVAYAILFRFDDDFHQIWKSRHDSKDSETKFRREGWRRAMEVLRPLNQDLESKIRWLYDSLIDLGAHPNVLAISQMSEYQIEPGANLGQARFSQILGQPHVDFAHVNTITAYSVLIDAVELIWSDRWEQLDLSGRKASVAQSSVAFLSSLRDAGQQAGS